MLASPAVYPLRRHSQAWRNHFVRTLPLIELACAAALILFPDAQLTLPGVCGLGLHFAAGSLRTLLVVTACFLWAMTGLNSPAYFAHAEGCNRYYCFWRVPPRPASSKRRSRSAISTAASPRAT